MQKLCTYAVRTEIALSSASFSQILANVLDLIAVSLEGTVLCESKRARPTLHKFWFQMLVEFHVQGMCHVLVESIGIIVLSVMGA